MFVKISNNIKQFCFPVMKPLINQMPLIGGVQYFFLNPPSLDFNLIGIADVLDMPGLADLMRRIVQEQIAAM